MDTINLIDFEVWYHVGVTGKERAKRQRLWISVEMERDVTKAAATDDLRKTIDYFTVSRRLEALGKGRSWKLIETLAVEIARMILKDFGAKAVSVEVKKFILPKARHVSVKIRRKRK